MQVPTLSTLASTEPSKSEEQPPATLLSADVQDAAAFHSAGPYFPEPSVKAIDSTSLTQPNANVDDSAPTHSVTLPEISITSPTHSSPSPLYGKDLSTASATEAKSQRGDDLTHVEPIPHVEPEAATITVQDTAPYAMSREPPALDLSDSDIGVWQENVQVTTDRALLIGISGSPSSGKSTMLNMLKLILPSANPMFCIHQDDFDLPKSVVNLDAKGGHHEGCMESVDWESMRWVLDYTKRKRRLPLHYASKHNEQEEKMLAIGKIDVDLIDGLHAKMESSRYFANTTIGLVEGSLLYHDPQIERLLDVKVFMCVDEHTALSRTLDKAGGNDLEQEEVSKKSFETKLWPSYVQTHAPQFKGNDVEGELDPDLMRKLDIIPQPALTAKMQATQGFEANLQWVYKEILRAVRRISIEQLSDEKLRRKSGRHEPCDCQEGLLGKIRKAIYDFL